MGAAASCPCSDGSAFLECGEQPAAIAIKKSRQQKRNGQTRFIEASLFLLSVSEQISWVIIPRFPQSLPWNINSSKSGRISLTDVERGD